MENHTWSHPDLTTLPPSGIGAQIDMTQAAIEAQTGVAPRCVRPPDDTWNASVLDQVAVRGLTTMSYSVDPRDWTQPGVGTIVSRVVSAAFPGAVVDLHDGGGDRGQTVAALPLIVSQLRAAGYAFVSVCARTAPRVQVTATAAFGDAPAPGPPALSNLPLRRCRRARSPRLLGGGLRRWDLLVRRRPVPRIAGGNAAERPRRGDGGIARRRRLLVGGLRRWDLLVRRRPVPWFAGWSGR